MANERYTNDVLKVTGQIGIPNPETGNNALTKNVWGLDYRALFLVLDGEFALSYAGNPNGNIASAYEGRKVWDTATNSMWICTGIGDTATAEWTNYADLLAAEIGESILGSALAFAIAL